MPWKLLNSILFFKNQNETEKLIINYTDCLTLLSLTPKNKTAAKIKIIKPTKKPAEKKPEFKFKLDIKFPVIP